MAQHFLLSAAARTLSLKTIYSEGGETVPARRLIQRPARASAISFRSQSFSFFFGLVSNRPSRRQLSRGGVLLNRVISYPRSGAFKDKCIYVTRPRFATSAATYPQTDVPLSPFFFF